MKRKTFRDVLDQMTEASKYAMPSDRKADARFFENCGIDDDREADAAFFANCNI